MKSQSSVGKTIIWAVSMVVLCICKGACMKERGNFARISKVLQADKSVMSEGCKTLILQDFMQKFNDYFDVNQTPSLEITNKNGTYRVEIVFEAERIKKFHVLR